MARDSVMGQSNTASQKDLDKMARKRSQSSIEKIKRDSLVVS